MNNLPVIPCILPGEFRYFAALLQSDADFPQTYSAWLQRTYRDATQARRRSIDVHPQEFADYCRRHGTSPRLAALQAFAAIKASGMQEPGAAGAQDAPA